MTGPLPDPPELEPTALSGTNFGRARRGFEPTEVRSMLGRAADALRVWAERDAKLAEQIADLTKRLEAAERFDEARVTELLGAETARIVTAARDAATEIRGQADKESSELLERSRAEAESVSSELREAAAADRAEAEKMLAEATEAASETTAAATAEADGILTDARSEADGLRESAREEAERVSLEAAETAAKLTSDAQARHDEMIEAAAKVLGERTTEAEAAASEIRSAATDELDRARAEARSIVESAETDAATTRDEARAQGREMVEEARELRRQMLHDIAERARAGRQKVEAAKAARAEVLRAIRAVGGELDDVIRSLSDHDQAMRGAADTAAAAVTDDVEQTVKRLEDQLTVVPDVAGAPEEGGKGLHEVGSEDTGSDAVEVDSVEAVEPLRPVGPASTDDEPESDDEPDESGEGSQMASVHDLFEKLRSEERPSPEEVHPGGGGTGSLTGSDASEHVGESASSTVAVAVATLTEVAVTEVTDAEVPVGGGAAVEAAGTPGTDLDEGPDVGDEVAPQSILDRRDELLEPAEKLLGRTLKRLLSDEQNEVLDRVRRHKRSRVEVADLLGEADVVEVFTSKLSDAYATAAAAGATMWVELSGDDSARSKEIDVDDPVVAAALEAQVDELLGFRRAQLREVLEAHSEAGADPAELVDSLRSAYRDLRTSSVDQLAGDLATGGFAAGTAVAAGPSTMWRWVPDNGGLPCADAEDNALEGPVGCGAAFPTGDVRPPAHPGCRCVVVPAGIEVP